MTYNINPAVQLHWASWDDEYVVFDEGSGQTHQMDSVRAFLLDMMLEGPRRLDELHSALSCIPSLSNGVDLKLLLSSILSEFSTHGLVEATTW
nr:HPr-rel-A system PqqD family peptide chaperone [uncultured Albidiferax sp.]